MIDTILKKDFMVNEFLFLIKENYSAKQQVVLW
jgi:hypothetical protein